VKVSAAYRRLYSKGQGKERRNKATTRNEEVEQTNYTKGRKTIWNIYRGCQQKELPSNFYIINR
jgi:hypothetical protein